MADVWLDYLSADDGLTHFDGLIGVTYGKGPWLARMFSTTFFICFQNFCRSYCELVISLKLHFFKFYIHEIWNLIVEDHKCIDKDVFSGSQLQSFASL